MFFYMEICPDFHFRHLVLSKDPTDPDKTRMAILAHADPGGGIPQWAMKTAMNAVAPIEPFKLFYKIDERVAKFKSSSPRHRPDFASQGRTQRPAGLSQLGYCCFWPNGGGRVGHVEPLSSGGDSVTGNESTRYTEVMSDFGR